MQPEGLARWCSQWQMKEKTRLREVGRRVVKQEQYVAGLSLLSAGGTTIFKRQRGGRSTSRLNKNPPTVWHEIFKPAQVSACSVCIF
jgi:hypothetical protein